MKEKIPVNVFNDMEIYINEQQSWYNDNQSESKEVFDEKREAMENKCREMIAEMSKQNVDANQSTEMNMDDLKEKMNEMNSSKESYEQDGPSIEEVD
jgi:hypothetical protein